MSEMASQIFGSFDYVIVGAGSAGCVLANRLTRDASIRVLLLEAGGEDRNWWIKVPVGMPRLLGNREVDWCYQSEPEPYADNRITPVPRGKTLGGSSSINSLCYVRGHRLDYDGWRDLGNPGWSWEDVLPFFRSLETHPRGASDVHGSDGELCVTDNPLRWDVVEAWKRAAIEFGIPESADQNAGENDGLAYFQGTIRNGRRSSASEAFLHPIRRRSNLQVATHAHVTGLRFEGKRVTGVEFVQNGTAKHALAQCEVLLAAGAIGSPQLMELSGVGQGALLQKLGIAVRHDLPGVGENMQDHWQLRCSYRVKNTVTMNEWVGNPLRRYAMGAWYLLAGRGPMAFQTPQLCAFTRSDPAQAMANLQYHVSPASADRFGGPLHGFPGMSCGIAVVRPQSVGHCHVKSADPFAHPAILHNFLESAQARRVAVDSIRLTRRLVAGRALEPFAPEEIYPGPQAQSDEEILAYARQTVITVFHQSGTCKMGRDAMAVVDERLLVRGLLGLRVVDASIMPTVPRGNTNVPTMMIAEKAAKMIDEDRRAGNRMV